MDKGDKFDVDLTLDEARSEEFDALMIPGGLYNPDAMRSHEEALDFARHFFEAGKPVATICHGPQVLISADLVRGRKMTSWPAIKVDMRNAGAIWVDQEVIVDNGLVSSRKPDDIPAFNKKMIEEFVEGRHAKQSQMAGVELET
jgi:protease I